MNGAEQARCIKMTTITLDAGLESLHPYLHKPLPDCIAQALYRIYIRLLKTKKPGTLQSPNMR